MLIYLKTAISVINANKKLVASIAGIAALVTALYKIYDHGYESGSRATRTAIQAEHNQIIKDMQKQHEEAVKDALSLIQKDHADEIERVRAEREIVEVVKKVTEYVDREIPVEVPGECVDISNDIIGVLSKATSIVSSPTSGNGNRNR